MMNTLTMFGVPRQNANRSVAALLAIMLAMSLACWFGWRADPHLSDENHFMENTQAVFLALAWLVHGWRASKVDRRSVEFTFHIGLSLLMYSFLLRELDISEMDAPGSQVFTWTEHILRGIGWTCWVLFLVRFFRQIKQVLARRWALLATPVMIVTLCGAVLMAAGWPFDKKVFHSLPEPTSEFIEELLEINAYLLLFVGAMSDSLPGTQSGAAADTVAASDFPERRIG